MSITAKRTERDISKLIENNHEVTPLGPNEFSVLLKGPPDSMYKGGIWKIRVLITKEYPFSSPSIGFINPIYHPNVDEKSGTVCMNVLNETWSPVYDLVNIFESFLPQLLTYPNATDPLNVEAAKLLITDEEVFKKKVEEHITSFATEKALKSQNEHESSSDSDMSTTQEHNGAA